MKELVRAWPKSSWREKMMAKIGNKCPGNVDYYTDYCTGPDGDSVPCPGETEFGPHEPYEDFLLDQQPFLMRICRHCGGVYAETEDE
jgi:hypothetical protein